MSLFQFLHVCVFFPQKSGAGRRPRTVEPLDRLLLL